MDVELKIARPYFAVSNTDASFDVSVTNASYEVSHVKSSYELTSTTATFEVSTLAASFSVSHTNITPTVIELGLFLLKHNAADFGSTADFTSLVLGKGVSDTILYTDTLSMGTARAVTNPATVGDSIDRFDIGTVSQDTVSVAELVNVTPAKVLIDAAGAADQLTRLVDFHREFASEGVASETTLFSLDSNASDSAATSDSVAFQTVYLRDYADSAVFSSSSEIVNSAVGKGFGDTVAGTEAVTFALTIQFLDLINVTDDFDGEAVLDDDQTMVFAKTTGDAGSVADAFSRASGFHRAYQDTADWDSTIELITLSAGKGVTDNIDVQETLTLQGTTLLQDTPSVSDAHEVYFATNMSDNGNTTDSDVKSVSSLKSEPVSVTDSGLLYGQDYVDTLTYFASDYVGFSRNF